MNKNCTILLNSNAGALRISPSKAALEEIVSTLELDAEVQETFSAEEMRSALRNLKDQETKKIVVAGGDGTVSLAAQELAYSASALGIIPQGTANNFATALHLPQDLPSALRVVRDGEIEEVSLGEVEGRYFIESAGVGLFADVLSLYGEGTNKNLWRAIYSLLRILLSLKSSRLQLQLDGKAVTERSVMCVAANSFRLGAALPIAPEAKLTDEVLDVVVVGDISYKEILQYYRAIRTQLHMALPKVTIHKAKTIKISSRAKLNVHADDQVVNTTPISVHCRPRALRVIVDRLYLFGKNSSHFTQFMV